MSERRPARPAARPAARTGGAARPSAFMRGAQGMERTDVEIQRNKDRAEQRKASANKPFRFFVPIGDTRQVIVVDDKPDFFLYEHALKDADGKWGRLFTGCIKEYDSCPVCRSTGKESYYAMVLTVIDLTPFDTRDGDTVEFSRKLLIVKPAQQKKFLRFYNKEGTLRGALFDMTRDGDKDSSIGNDIEFVEFVDEDEMATYTRSWKDREGKRHNEDCAEAYVYEDLFDEPTMENLTAIVGGDSSPVPGSRASNDRELGGGRGRPQRGGRDKGDDWEDPKESRRFGAAKDDEDEVPARPARRGRAAEVEDVEAKPARRGRAAPVEEEDEAPAPPARRGRAAPPPEPDEDDEDDEDDAPAPPARRGRAAPAEAAPPARRGRAAPAADEDDEDDDAPPARPARRERPAPAAPAPNTRRGVLPARTAAKPARKAKSDFDDMDDDIPF